MSLISWGMAEAPSLLHSARFRSEILQAERVLCVQPHYDDNDIAAGGTFALLADAGRDLASTPISVGELQVQINVQVLYGLD